MICMPYRLKMRLYRANRDKSTSCVEWNIWQDRVDDLYILRKESIEDN